MANNVKNIAVILAGGTGKRFYTEIPKQFAKLAGKSTIEHTVEVFDKCGAIDEIAVVIHKDYVQNIEGYVLSNNWLKVKKILTGGEERYLSSLAAIEAYRHEQNVNLIFHDAVRPLLSESVINNVITALETYDAVDVAIPAADTIIEVDTDLKQICGIPDRSRMYLGQTPQGFKLPVLEKAYRLALRDPSFKTTDDCGAVKKYLPETKIFVVEGLRKNHKLTHMEDLFLLDKLFQLNSAEIPECDLAELKGKCLAVFGGNSGIGACICETAKKHGAKAYSFSRKTTRTDIRNVNDINKALESVYEKEKRIDYIVCAAAVLRKEALHLMNIEDIEEMTEINYKGMVFVSYCSHPYLKESRGQLLHFTSSSYTLGRAFYGLYSSAKAAAVNFSQALSQEWQTDNIRVNCMNPERTKTAMRIQNFGFEDEKTLLDPKDVAEASLKTLLSKYSGQVVDVRGAEL